jgi:hypothetical protein
MPLSSPRAVNYFRARPANSASRIDPAKLSLTHTMNLPVKRSLAAAAVLLASGLLVCHFYTKPREQTLAAWVTKLGKPTFLATQESVQHHALKQLYLTVLPLDPQAVTNWNAISNVVAVWVSNEPTRLDARRFYDFDLHTNNSTIHVAGFQSFITRSLLGDKVVYVTIGSSGRVEEVVRVRVDAVVLRLPRILPPGREAFNMPSQRAFPHSQRVWP